MLTRGDAMTKNFLRTFGDRRARPMRALAAIAVSVYTLTPSPALAHMSGTEFEARVRDYLLAHPEIILEVMEALSEREARAAQSAQVAKYPDLFDAAPILGIGPEDAPIRVVEFFDYNCVPCKTLHPDLVAELDERLDIRVELRHLPILSPSSERGARFALAVKTLGVLNNIARCINPCGS